MSTSFLLSLSASSSSPQTFLLFSGCTTFPGDGMGGKHNDYCTGRKPFARRGGAPIKVLPFYLHISLTCILPEKLFLLCGLFLEPVLGCCGVPLRCFCYLAVFWALLLQFLLYINYHHRTAENEFSTKTDLLITRNIDSRACY